MQRSMESLDPRKQRAQINRNRPISRQDQPGRKQCKKDHGGNAPDEGRRRSQCSLQPCGITCGILHLSQALGQAPLSEFPGIEQALFGEVDALHVWCIGGGGTADPGCDHNRVGLEDDSVVDNLVNCEGDQVVVLDDGTLVRGAPVEQPR